MKVSRDAKHQYTVDGQTWPGVTTILKVINKPQLNRWREDQGRKQADEIGRQTADHGTFVHMLATLHSDGEAYIPLGDDSEEKLAAAKLQAEAFVEWWDANVVECIGSELFVAHPTYQYAGALDFLLRIRGDKMYTVTDIKTTAALYREQRAQTAAYRAAALATILKDLGERSCRRGVLWLPSGENAGKCRFDPHDRHAEDWQAFLSALYLYRWLKN